MSLARNPNVYYGGRGSFFGSIGNALSKAHDWVKSNKIISTVGRALGAVGVPYAGAIGSTAATLGYGRRRKRVVRRRRVGGSLRSILSGVHSFVKKHQLVSKGLSHLGHHKLSSAAGSLGYGRRRVGRPRRVGRHRLTVRRRAVRRRRVGGSLRRVCQEFIISSNPIN